MFSRADELRMSELGDRALPSLTDNERAEYSDLSSRYKQFLDAGVLRLQTLKQLDRPQLYAQPGAVALLASQLPFFFPKRPVVGLAVLALSFQASVVLLRVSVSL